MTEQDIDHGVPEPRASLFEPLPPGTAEAAPARVVRDRRGGTPFAVTLLLMLVLAGAGFWAWTHPHQGSRIGREVFANTPAAEPASADPAEAVNALSARVALLEKQMPNAGAPDSGADLARKLDDLSARVDGLASKQGELAAQSEKNAELLAQKSAAVPQAEAAPPGDNTASQVPALEAQQQSSDAAHGLTDKVTQQQAAFDQAQASEKAALDAIDQRLTSLEQSARQSASQKPAPDQADQSALNQAQAGEAAALAALDTRVGKLEQATQPGAADQADQKALSQAQAGDAAALAALDARLGKLEQVAGQASAASQADQKALDQSQAGDKQALDALDARIAKLEQATGQATGAAQDATRAARIAAAQAALAAGQPLGDVPGAPPPVARFAKDAPPTEAALRASFPLVASNARAASQPAATNSSFFDRMLSRAQQSVVVRQGDHVIVGDPAAGVLARAQDQVNAGDLKDAVTTLGGLQGLAAQAVQGWVGQARALIDARDALAGMAAHG